MKARLGFVIPWYGEDIGGGAEAACRSLAKALLACGADVEVLTTSVREFAADWNENFHPEGLRREGGVPVRRFRVRPRDTAAFDRVNDKLMRDLAVTPAEEEIFMREMVRSPALGDFLDAHRGEYVYLFMPYMFGTTYDGVRACPDRSVVIPCLHDESYARLKVLRPVFERARGLIFLSHAEQRLAESLYRLERARLAVLGSPVDCLWRGDGERFRARHGLPEYLLYAGRTDKGKGAELLADYFGRYVEETGGSGKLAFLGGGRLDVPASLERCIVRLGFLAEQEKHDCYAGALALAVPGVKESFSIVMMESWLAGRPVIANAACEVTTEFCRLSNGGLFFASYAEFREIVTEFRARPDLAGRLGAQGREFVRASFQPERVARRYLETLAAWFD